MPTSPIDILDNDILLSIFDSITSQLPVSAVSTVQDKNRPITVIRAASQVCRRWRALMLASPWIWGRLIDLQELVCHQEAKWMEEVARRSESAPLWIYGDVRESSGGFVSTNTQQYFIRVLESWQRIEKISVGPLNDKKILDELHIRMLSRAPILKLLDVSFFGIEGSLFLDTLQPGSSKRLFADYAPSLQSIRAGQIAFRVDSPWLSNIREIVPFPKHLTLENIFVILRRTPVIERIRIQNMDFRWVQPPFPKLRLPNLSSICLLTGISVVAGFLGHVAPGRLSNLTIVVQNFGTEVLNEPHIISSFKENGPSYISNYFTANKPTTLLLAMFQTVLRVSDTTNDFHAQNTHCFELGIDVKFRDQRDWDNLVACLLDSFTRRPSCREIRPSSNQLPSSLLHKVQPNFVPKLYSMLVLVRRTRYPLNIYSDSGMDVLFCFLNTILTVTQL